MDVAAFVQNVKDRCSAKGMGVTAACQDSGAGKSFISDLNRGIIPRVERLEKLATYLGTTVSDLLGEGPSAAAPKPDFLIKFEGLEPGDQQEVIAIIEMKSARKKT